MRQQNEMLRGPARKEMSGEERREFDTWWTDENEWRCRVVRETDAYRLEVLRRLGTKFLPEWGHGPCMCTGTHCSGHVTRAQRMINERKRKELEAAFAVFAERRRKEKRGCSLYSVVVQSSSLPSPSNYQEEAFKVTELIGSFDGELVKLDEIPRSIFRSNSF